MGCENAGEGVVEVGVWVVGVTECTFCEDRGAVLEEEEAGIETVEAVP